MQQNTSKIVGIKISYLLLKF